MYELIMQVFPSLAGRVLRGMSTVYYVFRRDSPVVFVIYAGYFRTSLLNTDHFTYDTL